MNYIVKNGRLVKVSVPPDTDKVLEPLESQQQHESKISINNLPTETPKVLQQSVKGSAKAGRKPSTKVMLDNDLTEDDQINILNYITNSVQEMFTLKKFSINDISKLSLVSQSSIQSRVRHSDSPRKIISDIMNNIRAPRVALNKTNVKSFIETLDDEAKEKLLDELVN